MPRLTMPRAVALGGAVLAIVAFFLPWVQYANATYSGADLAAAVTKAGGLRGFDVSLYAIPVIALISIVLALLAARAKAPDAEARFRILASAASIAGLAVSLLFLGSAVLGASRGPFLLPLQLLVLSGLLGAVALGTLIAIIRFAHR